jgi:hypothetical protein
MADNKLLFAGTAEQCVKSLIVSSETSSKRSPARILFVSVTRKFPKTVLVSMA